MDYFIALKWKPIARTSGQGDIGLLPNTWPPAADSSQTVSIILTLGLSIPPRFRGSVRTLADSDYKFIADRQD
jgi:hypothetical protein